MHLEWQRSLGVIEALQVAMYLRRVYGTAARGAVWTCSTRATTVDI